MKQNFFKGAIFLMAFLLFNCSKDDYPDLANKDSKNLRLSAVCWSQFQKKPKAVEKLRSVLSGNVNHSLTARYVFNADYGIFIDTTYILKIEENGIHSFTMRIKGKKDNEVENLILKSNIDGSYKAYMAKYNLSENDMVKLSEGDLLTDKKPDSIKDMDSYARYHFDGDGAECLRVRSYQVNVCENANGNTITDNGELGNGCVRNWRRIEYTVLSFNQGCLGSSGFNFGPPASNQGSSSSGSGVSTGGGSVNPNPDPVPTAPVMPQPQPRNSPCDQLKEFGDPAKMNLKPNIDWLKSKVNAAVNMKEFGVTVKKSYPDEPLFYDQTQITSGDNDQVLLRCGGNYIGGIHTHPSNGHSMFSFADVYTLYKYYTSVHIDMDKADVFTSLVCKHPVTGVATVYTLKITNTFAFQASIENVLENPDYIDVSEDDIITAKMKTQEHKYNLSGNELEKAFLIQFANWGISLYSADDDSLTHWTELALDPAGIVIMPKPCN